MSNLVLDAEALYRELLAGVRQMRGTDAKLVGITSGGAWLAERLQQDLSIAGNAGVISSAMHRDDFAKRGMSGAGQQTQLDFDVNGSRIILLDDVLYTGRTIRAVINELFDYGRPENVKLAAVSRMCVTISRGKPSTDSRWTSSPFLLSCGFRL